MSHPLLPGPDGPGTDSHDSAEPRTAHEDQRSGGERRSQHRPNSREIPDEEACLRGLGAVPGLVATRLLNTAQANAITGAYRTILSHHQRRESGRAGQGIPEAALDRIARENPDLLSMFEPMLTDEQIELIIKNAKDAHMGKLSFCEQLLYLNRQPIRFDGRPYLPAMYDTPARNVVIRASRQVEKSTFLANTILYEACTNPGISILLIAPRVEQCRVFHHARLLAALEESPIIRRALLGRGKGKLPVMNTRFANRSQLYLRAAFHNADSSRGISADLLLIDEYQDIGHNSLPVLQETLSHSTQPRTLMVGTPKSIDNHLESAFLQSTANQWTVGCSGCSRGVVLDDRVLGPSGLICPHCQSLLDPRHGKWQPRNPAATWEGFHVNHLMVPWLHYDDILERQRTYDPSRFRNEVLGLPCELGQLVVTRAELEACCCTLVNADSPRNVPRDGANVLVAGIDWGGGGALSRTVLVIGYMRSDYRFHVCRLERFSPQEDPEQILAKVAQRCERFRVRIIGADGGGNGHVYNRLLLGRLAQRRPFYAILYSAENHAPRQDGVLWKWTVNRSATIGSLFGRVKRKMIYFPRIEDCGSFLDEFACVAAEYDDHQRTIRYICGETQSDDAMHATNYAVLAAMRHFPGNRELLIL